MKRFILFFAILLGITATCEANSVQAAASSSVGIEDHASLQVTSSSPKHNLRQSIGRDLRQSATTHESLDSNSSSHLYRRLEYLDFKTELGPEEISFLVIVVVILFVLCCLCGGGRRGRRRGGGGSCSSCLCDILFCCCIWEMCCDQGDPTDFCLV
jgi:hypothetical protein